MKKALCLCFALLFSLSILAPAFAAAEKTLTLARNGETDYRIVVSAQAEPAETTAANTLADYLARITGAAFPVVTDATAPTDKELVVGATNRVTETTVDRSAMDDDAVRIFTEGDSLYLTGGSARGTLYAVYTFLEDWLGCRWFTHDLTVVPEQAVLTVPAIDYSYEPSIRLRQSYWLFSTMYADYCAAHKLHGVMAYLPEELGGGRYEMAISSVHTLQQIVPPSLFETHPEYFGCDDSGVRSSVRQPCLRNEEVFRLAVEWAKNYFASYNAVLSVSQNDCMDFCRCEACKAFNTAHGGTDAAAMLDFVNRVAAEVKKDYPDARLETLAYQNSQTPPTGLTVADNVVIRLCAISTCVLHDLDDLSCADNAEFSKDLDGWSALTENLYVWDYSTNFQYYYALFPNLTTLQNRYRYYKDHHVVSVFDNGCGADIVPGEFHELRTYLILKLMWDPDTDVERHMREFCDAYYGAAGPDVIGFIQYFEKYIKGFNAKTAGMSHMSCQDGGVNLNNRSSLSSLNVKHLDKLMAQAQARALSDEEAHRLEGLALSWRFFKNGTWSGEFNWLSGLTDPEAASAQLTEDMKAYGITVLNESGSLALDDRTPDYRQLPTFWYSDGSDISQSMRLETNFRVFIHKLLTILCAPLRMFSRES